MNLNKFFSTVSNFIKTSEFSSNIENNRIELGMKRNNREIKIEIKDDNNAKRNNSDPSNNIDLFYTED